MSSMYVALPNYETYCELKPVYSFTKKKNIHPLCWLTESLDNLQFEALLDKEGTRSISYDGNKLTINGQESHITVKLEGKIVITNLGTAHPR